MSNSPGTPLTNLFDLNKIQSGFGKFQQNVLKNIPSNLKQNGNDFIKNVTSVTGNILNNLGQNQGKDDLPNNSDMTAEDNTKKILSAVESMNGNPDSQKLIVVRKKAGQQNAPESNDINAESSNSAQTDDKIPEKKKKKKKNNSGEGNSKKKKTFFVDDGTVVREEDESFAEFVKIPEKKPASAALGILSWLFPSNNSQDNKSPDSNNDVESLIESNNTPVVNEEEEEEIKTKSSKKSSSLLSFVPFFGKESATSSKSLDQAIDSAPKNQIGAFFQKMKQAVGLAPKQPDRELWFYERWLKSFDDWISAKLHLTIVQRVVGFVLCTVMGAACLFLGTYFLPTIFLTLSACLFGLLYSMANIFFFMSTCFVAGPVNQIKSMCNPVRIIPSSIYMTTLLLTLVSALYLHSGVLVFILVFFQLFSLGWYLFTFIPFANSFASRMLANIVLGRL